MPSTSLLIRSTLFLLTLVAFALEAQASSPFWVLLRNGEQLEGQVMHFWHGGKETTLDERVLFDGENPPRAIRRSGAAVRRSGPFVEFTNGDLLPGRVTAYRPASSLDLPATLSLTLGPGSAMVGAESGEVRLRADQVRVMVWSDRRRLPRYQPGAVLFRDGRRVQCRAVRMTSAGVTLLTEQGLLAASFAELSELHLPGREYDAAETGLRWLAWAEQNMLLESLVLTDGARLTFPQGMTNMETHYQSERFAYCAVQPRWALDTLYFDPEQAAVSVYRRLNEVPLSLLPVSAIRQEATLHNWTWQADRNIHGDLLASGSMTLSEGFGVHGNTTLAVDLPAGAVSMFGWVGIDRSVGDRGAMQAKILRNEATGETLWQTELIRGGEPAQSIGPIELNNVGRVLLVAEQSVDDSKQQGVDPFDIGDSLCWLLTTVTLSPSSAAETDLAEQRFDRFIPELAGWRVAENSAEVQLRPIWNEHEDRWRYSVGLRDPEGQNSRILLTRRLKVSLANAYLTLSAASHQLHAGHELSLWVDDERVGSTMNADPKTGRQVGRFDSRVYILGEYAQQEIDLVLRIEPSDPRPPGSGVSFEAAELRPLVYDLPADGEPLRAEISLGDLIPSSATLDGQPYEPRTDGQVGTRKNLNIRGYEFTRGISAPDGSEISYELQPEYTRFVALIGLANGWQGAGPFEILIDGQQAWISTDPDIFKRNTPGQQVSVPIPAGSKQITLKTGGRKSTGAWAEAGFVKE